MIIAGQKIVYVDNASTTQKPQCVIDAIVDHYKTANANVHRAGYELANRATLAYATARGRVADLVNAQSDQIVFTRGCTESINLLSRSITLSPGDEVVITMMEHHANIVPWQQACERAGATLKFIPLKGYRLDMDAAKRMITDKTKVVSVVHISNVLGVVNDVRTLMQYAKNVGAYSIIDAAQSVPHMTVNVQDLDCDFLTFSSHKMCGPTGIGALYGRRFDELQPFQYGGDMIDTVTVDGSTWNKVPHKFEAGTPAIEAAVGFGVAAQYVKQRYDPGRENMLVKRLYDQLKDTVNLVGELDSSILSFTVDGVNMHDLATYLGMKGVCVRVGHHCAMPLCTSLGVSSILRVSVYMDNTEDEMDYVAECIRKGVDKLC